MVDIRAAGRRFTGGQPAGDDLRAQQLRVPSNPCLVLPVSLVATIPSQSHRSCHDCSRHRRQLCASPPPEIMLRIF